MKFRYREMVYRPDYYTFHTDDREEWFPNGIFHYNVSRLIKDLAVADKGENERAPWINTAIKANISADESIHFFGRPAGLKDEHIEAADLERPLIFVELGPDSYNLIDGHHRLEKARRKGIPELPAWLVDAHAAIHYLGSEMEYCRYVEYWNSKIEGISDLAEYRGYFSPCPAPLLERDLKGRAVWRRLVMCLNECRRIEIYNEGNWFTLFRLNKKLYCGEAESHEPSIRCNTPFQITQEKTELAASLYSYWEENGYRTAETQKRQKEIRKTLRHADELMACVRVFSEY